MKAGYVALIGRPNSGKSTLLNNLLGHKVSITSPKPQTTRIPIQAIFEDERGQIIFIDTPGIFAKVEDPVSKIINPIAENTLKDGIDVILYLVDHTRDRSIEENKILGILRHFKQPKVLVINKIDIREPSFLPHYTFMEQEFAETVYVSAFHKTNLNILLDAIFLHIPERKKLVDKETFATPAINMNSKMFISEIIREKAYLFLRKETPYTVTATVDEVKERPDHTMYIKARIITTANRYKKMIIGKEGRMIKEIGMAVRKELETATQQHIYLSLTVEVNPHWYQQYL